MLKLAFLLLVGLLAVRALPVPEDAEIDQQEKPHDPDASKESNYKRYVGETDFKLPFRTRVLQAFQDGQTIHAVGSLNDDPKRVDFDFLKGHTKEHDHPLHFSIRFDEGLFNGKLVYNTFKDGNWSEDEQRISNPFKAGKEFDLRVRIEGEKYHVYANRRDIGSFDIRQQLDGIDHVFISGDLTALRLFHYGGVHFTNPYTASLPLKPGKRVDISGVPTGKRFNVNFYRHNREYALQISVRFSEGAVVRNAMQNNVWGEEEREGEMPIVKGEVFDLTVVNEEFSLQILFNGKRFATFAHRGSPKDFETLEIEGNVELHTVTINDAVGQ